MLRRFLPTETSLLFPFFSGVLLVLTLPYIGLWTLVWVSLVPFFLFATNPAVSPGRLSRGAMLLGSVYALGLMYPLAALTGWWWTSASLFFQIVPHAVLFFGVLGLFAAWFGLWYIPVAFAARRFSDSPFMPFVVAFVWVIFEWPHAGIGPSGFSWGALGYALVEMPFLKYLAGMPFLGVYALTFFVVLSNAMLVFFLRYFRVRAGGGVERVRNTFQIFLSEWKTYIGFWVFVCFLFSSFGYGVFREFSERATFPPLRVALISANIPSTQGRSEAVYANYREKLGTALSKGATLVVLPENIFPFFQVDEEQGQLDPPLSFLFPAHPGLYEDFLSLTRQYPDATIVVGLHTISKGKKYNSAVFYENGKMSAIYHKRTLVPFTEQIPSWTKLRTLEQLSSGIPVQYVDLSGMTIGVLLCSEISLTTLDVSRASLILSPSNDGTFTNSASALMQAQMTKMRALETGAYVLRAAKDGLSSIVDPNGNEIAVGRNEALIATITPMRK